MSLRGKIVLFYGLIVFIPTVLLAAGAGYYALSSVQDNYQVTINEAIKQVTENIQFRKQSYDLLAERTATDGELISRLSREHEKMTDQLDTVKYIDRSFQFMDKYLPGIKKFRIYHSNETLVQDGGLLWKPEERMLSGEIEKQWYKKQITSFKSLTWANVPNDTNSLVVSRKIVNDSEVAFGITYMLLDYQLVFGELFNQPFNGAGQLYLINENRQIIASSDSSQIGHQVENSDLQEYWAGDEVQDFTHVSSKGKQYLVRSLNNGWHVAAVIHMDQLEGKLNQILLLVIVGIVFFVVLSTFLILTVLKNIVWRIRKLGNRMDDIKQGEFDVMVINKNNDELGELEILFNSMSRHLLTLVQEITQAKLSEREQSFQALQAQINPHFIYNSLSLIRWRAMDLNDAIQLRTIDALITFYRLALDNKVNVTRIAGELEHVKAYIEIQQLRYPDRVSIEWDVDETLMELYTIKLLLQPIVENIYLHGNITGTKGAAIRISVTQIDDRIQFEIFDNGRGITENQLQRIREGERIGSGNGYGMSNIRERLSLYFGQQGQLEIDSVENEWTIVTITIPLCSTAPTIGGDK